MEEGDEEAMVNPGSASHPMLSATIGRVMATLVAARPRKLENAISRLSSPPEGAFLVSLDDSLWFLHRFVRDAADREEPLDDVLVPIIENSLKCKGSKYGSQAMVLINWLFEDELLLEAISVNLAKVLLKKEDRYIILGWCILVRGLLEQDMSMTKRIKHGTGDKHLTLLKNLVHCVPQLLVIVCNGSITQDGYELPTRLSVAAADCILSFTELLVKKHLSSVSSDKPKLIKQSATSRAISLVSYAADQTEAKKTTKVAELLDCLEVESLLWDNLRVLIILLQKLLAWNWKSRFLHAKGLEQVLKWLQDVKEKYGSLQNEAGSRNVMAKGALLLSSCWKHYGMLLHLEHHNFPQNYRELLEQYLSGIQFYTENCPKEASEDKDSSVETRKFFLSCLLLLLGCLDSQQLESTVSQYALQISQILISQLHGSDDDLIDGAVCLFKTVIFKMDSSSSRSIFSEKEEIHEVLPLLLSLLDEQDGTARAVVTLIADYCTMSESCIQEILKRLASTNVSSRRNAIDVISILIHKLSCSVDTLSLLMWQDLASHLLDCISDEDSEICVQASNLLPLVDPTLVLPPLVRLVYMSNKRIASHASDALLAVLKYHNNKPDVICMLLDCLSSFGQCGDLPKISGEHVDGPKLDINQVLGLIPEWSKSVKDWNTLIGPLIDKMFAEPSNATIIRFLSYISDQLAEAVDVVLHFVVLHTRGQEQIDDTPLQGNMKAYKSAGSLKLQQSLFYRLCPLLVIRLLPLKAFNDMNSLIMYGELLNEDTTRAPRDYGNFYINDDCVAALLLNRAFGKIEFEDVRKLAAELCGRIHPKVLFPIISPLMDHATSSWDILKIKACLYSVCTSLAIRGMESISHPAILKIIPLIEGVLLWPSQDGDEVSKAQHGCIDCLALMICAELQISDSLKTSNVNLIGSGTDGNAGIRRYSILSHVVHQLTHGENNSLMSNLVSENALPVASFPLPFRLCMANVLISACQKISDSGKKPLAQGTLPHVIQAVQAITESEIRAACVQVFFSSVYHLRSEVLPYARDLFKLSLKSLRKGSDKERIASAKLMASLMASEDAIVESTSGELLEAKMLLSAMSLMDPSVTVRKLCGQLLGCITSP